MLCPKCCSQVDCEECRKLDNFLKWSVRIASLAVLGLMVAYWVSGGE